MEMKKLMVGMKLMAVGRVDDRDVGVPFNYSFYQH